MIIVHLSGGLGNQMFQYAFGRTLAKRLGVELKLELTDHTLNIHNGFELDRIFNIKAKESSQADLKAVMGLQRFSIIRKAFKVLPLGMLLKSTVVYEPHFHFAPQMLALPDNSYVYGYWQSEKYFSEIENEIRSDFSFKLPLSKANTGLAEMIKSTNSVSLHVRRNDFAKNSAINATHGLCSLEHYEAAIQYLNKRVESPHYFVFSDDITWVRNNLKVDCNLQYVEHNFGADSYNDMRLMSLCKHHIIANSSFSWWGAWLNQSSDKIVIAPKRWFLNDSNTKDLIPQHWVRL